MGRIRIEGNTEEKRIVFYTALYRVFRRMIDNAEYGEYFSGFDMKVHKGEHFYTKDQLWDTFRTPHPVRMLIAKVTPGNGESPTTFRASLLKWEGTLSGWLVFSALGFFPVCPGEGRYAIGTPLFDEASISLSNGKVFKVTSPGAGEGKRYIQSARLNGKPLSGAFLTQEELAAGGELVFVMGDSPREGWD